ncbi:hypothetical protein CRG98_005392 [Punica granatum]|uniref:Reverse transcriptase Ty1/copia-type domain-containing protein n=1 Tax=Punica granatum TaxID=22663 RepID=A0A2I0L097_PUNGR|nr:hypothetical protein CRG98_005392 [Punica granatum]
MNKHSLFVLRALLRLHSSCPLLRRGRTLPQNLSLLFRLRFASPGTVVQNAAGLPTDQIASDAPTADQSTLSAAVQPSDQHASSSITAQDTSLEPSSFAKAKRDSRWVEAMREEFRALLSYRTWDLVPPPPNHHIIRCKWVSREGMDYEETFSPFIKPVTIHTVLTIATSLKWPIRKLDAKNAFLHGYLDEEVYMQQPPGFVDSTQACFVCRLNRSLYGPKQAPHAWFLRLSDFLFRLGFTGFRVDSSLSIMRTASYCIYLLVYVDDIILTGTPNAPFSSLVFSKSEFAMKDFGSLHCFLGIEARYNTDPLYLTQSNLCT